MSINSALLAGVSGLVANSSALAAISDNIANVNTTAYKRNQVDFSTMVTSQAVKGEYSAGGVQGVTKTFVSQQGLIQSSASATSLAISGDGFFVVTNKGAGLGGVRIRAPSRAPAPSSPTPTASWSMTPASTCRAGPCWPTALSASTRRTCRCSSRSM